MILKHIHILFNWNTWLIDWCIWSWWKSTKTQITVHEVLAIAFLQDTFFFVWEILFALCEKYFLLCMRDHFCFVREFSLGNTFFFVWEISFALYKKYSLFLLEILFALYEKYLLLSGRVGVYFHPGAVKSRQSASCWRQPILNPIFPLFILTPRSIHLYQCWVVDFLNWIAFPIFQSRTVAWPNIYKRFQLFQIFVQRQWK